MKGLCPDPRHDTVWMWSNKFVFEVEIDNEDREVWRLYLNEGKFQKALQVLPLPFVTGVSLSSSVSLFCSVLFCVCCA
jgi:hypothetical protein